MNTKDKIINLLVVTVIVLFVFLGTIAGYGMYKLTKREVFVADVSNAQVELIYEEIQELRNQLAYVRSELTKTNATIEEVERENSKLRVYLNELNYKLSQKD